MHEYVYHCILRYFTRTVFIIDSFFPFKRKDQTCTAIQEKNKKAKQKNKEKCIKAVVVVKCQIIHNYNLRVVNKKFANKA